MTTLDARPPFDQRPARAPLDPRLAAELLRTSWHPQEAYVDLLYPDLASPMGETPPNVAWSS